jgi:hypothetical protein
MSEAISGVRPPERRSMKITQDVRDYAATLNDKEQGLSAEAIAKAAMADMSTKFWTWGRRFMSIRRRW